MSDLMLRIERLQLRRAPGIDDGFTLNALSGGVNLVFGPNGSGKTTTSNAIEALLWHGNAPHHDVAAHARFRFGGAEWSMEVDGNRPPVVRCDGAEASAPRLPRADMYHRYRLHLHELLALDTDGSDFAAAIMLESAGGHDLDRAARTLGLAGSTARGANEARALAAAEARYRGAVSGEEALSREAASLHALHEQQRAAREAGGRATLLKAAIAHACAERELELATRGMQEFDARIERLSGDELDRLGDLENQAATAKNARRQAEERRDAAATELARLLPRGLPEDTLLPTLRRELGELGTLRQRIDSAAEAAVAAERKCTSAQEQMRGASLEQLATIDLGAIGDLARFASEATRVAAARTAAQHELELQRGDDPDVASDTLMRGLDALHAWLGAPDDAAATSPMRKLAIVGGVLTVLAGLAGMFGGQLLLGVFLAAGVVLLVLVLRERDGPDPRHEFRERYRRLGLSQPGSWDRSTVGELLEDTRRRWAAVREAESRRERRRDIEQRLAELTAESDAMERKRRALAERLGVPTAEDVAEIAWLGQRILDWQRARDDMIATRAVMASVCEQEAAARAAIATRLRSVISNDGNGADLAGAVDALERKITAYRDAEVQHRAAEAEMRSADVELRRVAEDRQRLLSRLEIAEDGLDLLYRWLDQHAEWRSAREGLGAARSDAERTKAQLEGTPGFNVELLMTSEGALQLEHDETVRQAAELESITRKVAGLEERISAAKQAVGVAEAVAQVARCREELAAAREADAERLVAQGLLSYLQGVTREQQRPAVFRAAQRIFTEITHGRYTLDLTEGDVLRFRARDNERRVWLALGELSSGTRVQLLLAVRLAFVESQEREQGGAKLPLLLDETLGTSDDARAQAIIEAVIEIARSGRQVFYFTAQRDEVEKWKGVLHALGEEARLIDLVEERRLAKPSVALHAPRALERAPLPAPHDCTHAEYGAVLGVPVIDWHAEAMDGMHLWHLVEDLPLLHHLLAHGIMSWGQLEAMVEAGGRSLLADYPEAYPRIRAAASALETAHRLSRQGRGRAVHARAIQDSDAVSGAFMERVLQLRDECGGDAQRLLESIDSLRGFRAAKLEQLKEYLIEHGYLSREPMLDAAEIHARTLGALGYEIQAGRITIGQLDRLVSAVLPPAVAAAGSLPIAHPGLAAAAEQVKGDAGADS